MEVAGVQVQIESRSQPSQALRLRLPRQRTPARAPRVAGVLCFLALAAQTPSVSGQAVPDEQSTSHLSSQIVSLMVTEAANRGSMAASSELNEASNDDAAQGNSARTRGLAGIRAGRSQEPEQHAGEPAVRKSFQSGIGVDSRLPAEPLLHVSRQPDRVVMTLRVEPFDVGQTHLPARAYHLLDHIGRAVSTLRHQLPSTRYTLEMVGNRSGGQASDLARLRALAIERFLLVRHALTGRQLPVTAAQPGETLAAVPDTGQPGQSGHWLQLVGYFQE